MQIGQRQYTRTLPLAQQTVKMKRNGAPGCSPGTPQISVAVASARSYYFTRVKSPLAQTPAAVQPSIDQVSASFIIILAL